MVASHNDRMSLVVKSSLKDQILAQLRTEILAGHLVPGTVYNAAGLAKKYGASRTPVREAILELESKGLVHVSTGVGFEVVEQSAEAVRHALEVREILETTALVAIAGRLTPAQVNAARTIAGQLEKITAADDTLEYIELNKAFHLYLAAQYGNDKLVAVLSELMDVQPLPPDHRDDRTAQQHERLLTALEAGDVATVRELVSQHHELSRTTWTTT